MLYWILNGGAILQLKKATKKKTLRVEHFFLSCTLGSRPPSHWFFLVFSLSRAERAAPPPPEFFFSSPSTPASTKPHSRTASSPPTRERAGPFSIASDPRSPSSAEQRRPHRQPAAPSTPGHRSTISQQRRPICHPEQRRRRWNP